VEDKTLCEVQIHRGSAWPISGIASDSRRPGHGYDVTVGKEAGDDIERDPGTDINNRSCAEAPAESVRTYQVEAVAAVKPALSKSRRRL
jgi:hypothetical protein